MNNHPIGHLKNTLKRQLHYCILCFFFVFGFLCFAQAQQKVDANIDTINRAIINDVETVSVFFRTPQSFKNIATQFDLFKAYDENYETPGPKVESGHWSLSKDGMVLSYSPLEQGSYIVRANQFILSENSPFKSDNYAYIGRPSSRVVVTGRGPVIPMDGRTLPIETIGVSEVDIEFFKIDKPSVFFADKYLSSSIHPWEMENYRKTLTPFGVFRYVLDKDKITDVALAQKTRHRLPIDKNVTAGAYVVAVKNAGSYDDNAIDFRVVILTDIGVHVRRYANKTLVIANHFSTAKPLESGTVEVWRNGKNNSAQMIKMGCQFEQGHCLIDEALLQEDVVVVKSGSDISMLPMREVALDLNDYPVKGDAYRTQNAYVYSNRTLYRPSEIVPIHIVLRDADANILPNQPIELQMIAPDGKVAHTETLTAIDSGFYQTNLTTDTDTKRGRWQVEVRTDPTSKAANGVFEFFIEEFMPERMELILSAKNTEISVSDMLDLNINARYLFGAKAAGNGVNATISLSVNQTPYIDHTDWFVGQTQFSRDITTESEITDTLDNDGHLSLSRPVIGTVIQDAALLKQVARATVTVNVLDSGTSGIMRAQAFNIWPQNVVPVIRPLFKNTDLGYGEKANFEIFAADQTGKRLARDLRLTLKYRSDDYIWLYSDARGWERISQDDMQIVEMKSFKAQSKPHQYEVDPSWGSYTLIVTDVETGFESQYEFSQNWDNDGGDGNLPKARPMALNFKTDKPSYDNGDTVKLSIDAPFAGELDMLIEGDKPLWRKQLRVAQGLNSIEIPVDANFNRHDLYITGLLLGKNEQEQITRGLGIIPLKLNRTHRIYQISTKNDSVVQPEKPFNIKVKLANYSKLKGQNSPHKIYATISITDQGILNMTPIQVTSIISAMFGQRAFGADIIDYYNRIYAQTQDSLLNPRFGGDGEAEATPPNLTEMKTVSILSDLLTFDDQGELKASFDLPDFNGEAKVVVKVFDDANIGEAESQLTIRAPIVADLITPQFLRVGDQTNVALSLHNMAGKTQDVKVSLTSNQIETGFSQSFNLQDQQHKSILIPIALSHFTDFAQLDLQIESPEFSTTRTFRMGIVPAAPRVTVIQKREINATQSWLKDEQVFEKFDGVFNQSLIVSPYPILDITDLATNLFRYPYGCTEQTTSGAFPWLMQSNPLLDSAKKIVLQDRNERYMNLAKASSSRVTQPVDLAALETKMMQDAVGRILNRQTDEGGFGLWSGETNPTIELSAYVTDFLFQAARKYPNLVPNSALTKSVNYLKKSISNKDYNLNRIGYAIWVLAREGKIFSADLLKFNDQFNNLTPLNQTYLAGANLMVGNASIGNDIIAGIDFNRDGYWGFYQTDASGIALSINVLDFLKQKGLYNDTNGKIAALFSLLNERISARTYYSTQEQYALVQAGLISQTSKATLSLAIDGEVHTQKALESVDASMIDSVKMSDKPFFMQYRVEGFPLKVTPMATFKAKVLRENSQSHYNVGDRALVVVTVTPERDLENALLVDSIPGGFIMENPNLFADGVDAYYDQFNRVIDGKGISEWRTRALHEEYRFDQFVASMSMKKGVTYRFAYAIRAQVPGSYQAPATVLEDMYLPMLRIIAKDNIEVYTIAPAEVE